MRVFTLLALGVVLTLLFSLIGCNDSSTGTNGTRGIVQLLVSDAPLHLNDGTVVKAVNVKITRVELLANETAGSPKVTLFSGAETINLLALANTPVAQLPQLGLASVPAGVYTQLRLIIDEAGSNVVLGDDSINPLVVASGEQTGLKVVNLNLTISAGVTQALLLDFDLSKLHETPQFKLTPNALRVVKLTDAGSVKGSLALPAETVTAADVVATLTIHHAGVPDAVAITQVVLNSSTPSATYVFNGIPAGNDYVVTVDVNYQEQASNFNIPTATTTTVTAGGLADQGTTVISGINF